MRYILELFWLILSTTTLSMCALEPHFGVEAEPDTDCESGRMRTFIEGVSSEKWGSQYGVFGDHAGFGDPSWHIYKQPLTAESAGMEICAGGPNDVGRLFWNYSEGGDHSKSPKLEILGDRYLVFSRGGLYHSLYDLEMRSAIVNEESPYHASLDSHRHFKVSSEAAREAVSKWKMMHLHEPIARILESSVHERK